MYYYSPPKESNVPLDDKLMLFCSFEEFTNSPLVFWEHIIKNTSYKTIWITRSEAMTQKLLENGIECCYINDNNALTQYFSRAKYVILDGRMPVFWTPYKGQLIVNFSACTHFCFDCFLNRSYEFFGDAFIGTLRNLKCTDAYMGISTASSNFTQATTAAISGFDARKVFVTGVPRTDAMYTSDGKSLLFSEFPVLKQYRKLILYTPTARNQNTEGLKVGKGYSENIFNLDDFNQLEFERFLEEHNIGIVFKMHPFDEYHFNGKLPVPLPKHCYFFGSNTFFGKTHFHLFNAFDCMISDLSSTAYEYLLLDRPIIFLHNEIQMFKNFLLGLVIGDESIVFPGRRVYNVSEFLDAITEAIEDSQKFCQEREITKNILHKYSDGKSCERVLQLIETYDKLPLIESIDYEMYTLNTKQELVGQLEDTKAQLENKKEQLEAILNSKGYKTLQVGIKLMCPPNSKRRKILSKLYKLINKR